MAPAVAVAVAQGTCNVGEALFPTTPKERPRGDITSIKESLPVAPGKTCAGTSTFRVRGVCGREVDVTVSGDCEALQVRDLKKAIPKEWLNQFCDKSCLKLLAGSTLVHDNMLLSDLPDALEHGFTVVATSFHKLAWRFEGMGEGASHWTPFAGEGTVVEGALQLKEPLYAKAFKNLDQLKDHVIELIYADENLSETDRATLKAEQFKVRFPFVLFYETVDNDGALVAARFKMVD